YGDGTYSRLFFSGIAGTIDAVDNNPHTLAYARRYNASPVISYRKMDIVSEVLPLEKYDVVSNLLFQPSGDRRYPEEDRECRAGRNEILRKSAESLWIRRPKNGIRGP